MHKITIDNAQKQYITHRKLINNAQKTINNAQIAIYKAQKAYE